MKVYEELVHTSQLKDKLQSLLDHGLEIISVVPAEVGGSNLTMASVITFLVLYKGN